MLIAEINNNCIFSVNFLKLLNLQNIFDCIFLGSVFDIDTDFKCARVENIAVAGVPSNLVTLFEKSAVWEISKKKTLPAF